MDTKRLDKVLAALVEAVNDIDIATDVSTATETDQRIGEEIVRELLTVRSKVLAMRNVCWPDYEAFRLFITAETELH